MTDDPDPLLHILRMTVLSEVRSDQPDLTLRQLAIMLTVYRTDEPQTVRGLAETLNISKPAVSRSLNTLSELDLAQRKTDPSDRRSVVVVRTDEGAAMMRRLAEATAVAGAT